MAKSRWLVTQVVSIWIIQNSHVSLVGVKNDIITLEKAWQFLIKLNIYPLCDPAFPILGIFAWEMKSKRRYMYVNIYNSFIYNSQKWKINRNV